MPEIKPTIGDPKVLICFLELTAEAFNVGRETGFTPRQLLEQRKELISELERVTALAREAMEKYNATDEYSRPLGIDYDIETQLSPALALIAQAKGKPNA
jgi:hypothetical protein